MTWWTVLAVLTLVVGVPLNLYMTVRLWRLHRQSPAIKVLRERGIAETAVLATTTVFGLIFLNNDMAIPPLATEATRFITRGIILILAIVPASYWLWIYRDR